MASAPRDTKQWSRLGPNKSRPGGGLLGNAGSAEDYGSKLLNATPTQTIANKATGSERRSKGIGT